MLRITKFSITSMDFEGLYPVCFSNTKGKIEQ